jgi:hypothetical protein
MESRRIIAWSSAMLCVLGVINFYNIPYVVFVILLRAFLSNSPTFALDIPSALRMHTALVTGAVASLGYGAVCGAFVLRDVQPHEHLAPVLSVPILALVLCQIASVPLTMAVFAAGLFQMRSTARLRQRAVPRSSTVPVVHGVLVEALVRRPEPATGGGTLLSDLQVMGAERDAALFASEAVAFAQSYEGAVRERALEYLEAALSERSGRSVRAAAGTAAVNWAAARGAAVVARVLERLPAVAGPALGGTGLGPSSLPAITRAATPNLRAPAVAHRVAPGQRV